jgi:hypothetical protein
MSDKGERLPLRAIDVALYPAVVNDRIGKPPRLDWLALRDLVIDPFFQRDITVAGQKNILAIARSFNWTAFSPIVVAPAGLRGKFSIIDGQHRAHAAKLIGLDRVPCAIVDIDVAAQAKAFGEINANITKMHAVARFHALVAAGDDRAVAVASIAADAGVTILRGPRDAKFMKPRQTLLSWQLEKFAMAHGRAAVVLALRAIADCATPGDIFPNNAGLLKYELVGGGAIAIAARMGWGEERLFEAFRSFDLGYIKGSGLGQGTRLNAAAAEIARRLDRHAQKAGFALDARVSAPAARSPMPAIVTRGGVSLPRLKSLESE